MSGHSPGLGRPGQVCHQIGRLAVTEQGRALAGIERGEVLVAGRNRGMLEMTQEPGLHREGRKAVSARLHFGDDPVGNAAGQTAGIGAGQDSVPGPRREQNIAMGVIGAGLGAGQEGRAQLRCTGPQRERGIDKELANTNKEIEMFQNEKQSKLNELDVVLTIKTGQDTIAQRCL